MPWIPKLAAIVIALCIWVFGVWFGSKYDDSTGFLIGVLFGVFGSIVLVTGIMTE